MRSTIIIVSLALAATGCGSRPVVTGQGATGAVRFMVGPESSRTLQYLASDIKAVRVSLKDADSGSVLRQDLFTGAALAAKLPVNGHSFAFTVQNLKVADAVRPAGYRYQATVEAFRESAATTSLGTTTSSVFGVQQGQTSTIQLPSLTLASTPTGSWKVTVNVNLKAQWSVRSYVLSLEQTNGQLATASITTNSASLTRTFNNVVAFPSGVSTLSITVNGMKSVGGMEFASTNDTVTASIQQGTQTTSTRALNLP
ncbi:hypothetical protein J7643_15950 [bacterium]|nr:hypothetical protein [bacterium]